MHGTIHSTLIALASVSSLTASSYAEGLDGRWQGYYTCGAHALKPEQGAFAWLHVGFNVNNGMVSGRHDFINRQGIPTNVVFKGRIEQTGSVRIEVVSRFENGGENFHQTLAGQAVSPGAIELTGPALNPRGISVRNCRLTLTLVAASQVTPAPLGQTPTHQDTGNQERQRLEAQRQTIETERQKVAELARRAAAEKSEATAQAQRAAEDRKAAEDARRQTEELKRQNTLTPPATELSPIAADPPMPEQSSSAPSSLPQQTASSNPLSVTAEIGILAVFLFGGIGFIVLRITRKHFSHKLVLTSAAPKAGDPSEVQDAQVISEVEQDEQARLAPLLDQTASPDVMVPTKPPATRRVTGTPQIIGGPPANAEQDQCSPEASDRTERHLAAILAADVVGYSRHMEQDEVGTLRKLRDLHRNMIAPRIAEYRGRVFKKMGDGFLAEFVSVVEAVHCAVDIQRTMAARNLDLTEGSRLYLRIGVNLGDVFCEGEDVFGDGVNIAARLESIAPPGGIYVSRAACDPIRERLAFDFEDLGTRQVKNITRPIHVFNVLIDGLAVDPGENGPSSTDSLTGGPEAFLDHRERSGLIS